jgi:hypothetical protein
MLLPVTIRQKQIAAAKLPYGYNVANSRGFFNHFATPRQAAAVRAIRGKEKDFAYTL